MPLIVANWKMNPVTLLEARKLFLAAAREVAAAKSKNKVVICPPAVYLSELQCLKKKFKWAGRIELGCQNIFWHNSGPFTGQISGQMVKQFGVKYVLIGHSETRQLGESDQEVNAKLHLAMQNKLVPILCVGYGLSQSQHEEEVLVHLKHQISANIQNLNASKLIVAYEPVWAIGRNKPETPEHAERVAMFIKIKFRVNKVIYGGSVNARDYGLFLNKELDGLLVGGESLHAEHFKQIIS